MTWEQLIEKVKDIKEVEIDDEGDLCFDGTVFYQNGDIIIELLRETVYFAKNRTPDQMYQIILALTDKGETNDRT